MDIDTVVLTASLLQKPDIDDLWIAFDVSTNLRYMASGKIASSLGPEKLKALPVFNTCKAF